MKFTKEIPTKPGLYAWRAIEDESCEVDAFAVIDINEELHFRTFDDCNPVSELGGEWCRLVPAEEIEKAWYTTTISYDEYMLVTDRLNNVMESF